MAVKQEEENICLNADFGEGDTSMVKDLQISLKDVLCQLAKRKGTYVSQAKCF